MINRDFKGIRIPKEIRLSKKLNLMEKLFYVEINSLDNNVGCFASNLYFSEFFGISKGRCSQIIKSLEKKGYVSITLEREGKNITKRVVKILNTLVNKLNTPSKYIKYPYLENAQDNNTIYNNTYITIKEFGFSEEVMKYIIEYDKQKKKKFKNFTDVGLKIFASKLKKLGNNCDDGIINVLKNSIVNGYEGIFEIKNNNINKQIILDDIKTKDDIREILDDSYMVSKINELKILWEIIDCGCKISKNEQIIKEWLKWIKEICLDIVGRHPNGEMPRGACIIYAKKRKEYYKPLNINNYRSKLTDSFIMYNKK